MRRIMKRQLTLVLFITYPFSTGAMADPFSYSLNYSKHSHEYNFLSFFSSNVNVLKLPAVHLPNPWQGRQVKYDG
jgi:hypothetical protein